METGLATRFTPRPRRQGGALTRGGGIGVTSVRSDKRFPEEYALFLRTMPAAIFYSNVVHFLRKKCWLYPHYRSQSMFEKKMVISMK